MRKCLLFILLSVMLAFSYADELDDKMRQLQELQKQLESTEQKAKQTKSKKQKTDSEIQRTSSLKKRTETNIKKLKQEETVVIDSLRSVSERLENAELRLSDMHKEQNSELDMLLRVDRSFRTQQINHRDHRYLKHLIEGSRRKIDSLTGYRIALSQARELHQNEATKISKNVKKESTTKANYDKQIKNLSSQAKQLTREEQKLLTQINQLKKDSASLESLISQLMAKSGKEPSSYQFTGKKISWPLRGTIIRSFGQETRSYGTSVVSKGIEIAAAEGTKVVAADDGEVIFSDRYGGQGKMIIIDHKNGFFTLYAYCSDLLIGRGTKVKRGQSIAKSGMTGSASQPSLHFELRKDGRAINPVSYLE